MATLVNTPALPEKGERVTDEVLSTRQYNVLALAQAFAGTANPSTVWREMILDSQMAFQYYRELEEKDGHVGSLLEQLKLSVLGLERQVTPGDDSQPALTIAEFVREQIEGCKGWHQVLDALLDAPGYGVAICEIVYDVASAQVGLEVIKPCPQELFLFGDRNQPQIGPLRLLKDLNDYGQGEEVPEDKFIVFSYRPRVRNRRGRPLLRRVFWPSWFGRQDLKFWLRFAEKGPGTAAVKYQQGATDDEKRLALEAAEAIISKVAVAIPQNFEMVEALLTSARSQNPAVYEKLRETLKAEIAICILGQTLTSQGSDQGAGSFALGKVHEQQKFERTKEVAQALEMVIQDQLVRPLVQWNFGPNAPMPKFEIVEGDAEDLAARSQVDDRLQKMGVPIPLSYARKKYSIPEPQGDDEILEPRQSPAFGVPGEDGPGAPPRFPQFADDAAEKAYLRDRGRLLSQLSKDAQKLFRQRAEDIAAVLGGSR